ncbi:hypothetical protein HDU99_008832 [Rhizoclosmatium hyalinum]|nr:hypothetical protein HDU99_008832 [Rhizoclosmatium hyalinum]
MPYPPLLEHKALGIKALDATKMHELRVYAKEVPGSAPSDGSTTGVYRNVQSFDALRKDFPTVKTLDDVFKSGLRLNPKGHCLGHRPVYYDYETKSMQAKDYVWQSYEQVEVRIKNFAWGLQKLVKDFGQTGDKFHIGIYAVNSPEYVITDYACHRFSNTLVALYDTLGADTSEFILNHAEIPVLITTLDKIPNIIELAPKCKYLKSVIIMDGNLHKTPEVKVTIGMGKQALAANGVQLHYFSEVEALGVKNQTAFRLPTPEDVAVISYTSGKLLQLGWN